MRQRREHVRARAREARVGGARDAVRRARGAVGGDRVRADARRAVARAGGVALICGRAHDGARADARAARTRVGLGACVAVVACCAVRHVAPARADGGLARLAFFAGLVAPAATQALPMRQLPAASTCEQEPARHASVVHATPSDAHAVPSAATGFEQTPVAQSHARAGGIDLRPRTRRGSHRRRCRSDTSRIGCMRCRRRRTRRWLRSRRRTCRSRCNCRWCRGCCPCSRPGCKSMRRSLHRASRRLPHRAACTPGRRPRDAAARPSCARHPDRRRARRGARSAWPRSATPLSSCRRCTRRRRTVAPPRGPAPCSGARGTSPPLYEHWVLDGAFHSVRVASPLPAFPRVTGIDEGMTTPERPAERTRDVLAMVRMVVANVSVEVVVAAVAIVVASAAMVIAGSSRLGAW